jgi:hypothetical protein
LYDWSVSPFSLRKVKADILVSRSKLIVTAFTIMELTDRTKLVYVLNRNAEGKLFPSSPLEAHKNHALVTNIIGVDQVSSWLLDI